MLNRISERDNIPKMSFGFGSIENAIRIPSKKPIVIFAKGNSSTFMILKYEFSMMLYFFKAKFY